MSNQARKSIHSLKTYIPGKSADEVAREFEISDVVKLASNENPFGPSPKALEEIKRRSGELYIYPDQKSILLKEALSSKLGLGADQIVVGNGSDEVMLLIVEAFLSAGEEVIISENTFSLYESVTNIMEGKIKFVPLKDFGYDINDICGQINDDTKLIWICSPNNPTGTITEKKEMDTLLKKIGPNTIVVIDEAYGDFVESKNYPNSLNYIKEGKNVIVLRTFSKLYGLAGLRVGYGIGKPELIKYLNMVKLPFNVNKLAQSAAVAALNDVDFVNSSLKNNIEGKKYLCAELKKLNIRFIDSEANFIMVLFDKNADQLFIELMKKGVIIRPLTSFGLPNAIRVSIGTPPQNKRFIDALKEILK